MDMPKKPQWTLDLTWHEDGTIATVAFSIETYRPITSAEDAVANLTAVAHWWLDTKQYIHPGLAAEGA